MIFQKIKMKAVTVLFLVAAAATMAAGLGPVKLDPRGDEEAGGGLHGRKFGMPAPAIVYSVTVRNRLPEAVAASVVYRKVVTGETTTEREELQAGASRFFDRKTYEEGSARYSYVIDAVEVSRIGADEEVARIAAPFKVSSPTRNYVVVVEKDEFGRVSLSHAAHVEDEDL